MQHQKRKNPQKNKAQALLRNCFCLLRTAFCLRIVENLSFQQFPYFYQIRISASIYAVFCGKLDFCWKLCWKFVEKLKISVEKWQKMRFVLSLIISFLYDWIYFYIFFLFLFLYLYMAIFALSAMRNEKWAQGKLLCGAHKRTGLTAALRSEYFGFPMLSEASSAVCGGSRLHRANRGSAALRSVRVAPRYWDNNLSRHEVPQAVEHPRRTEKPPGTPSGRRLRLGTRKSPVERLFPLFKGESHAGAWGWGL